MTEPLDFVQKILTETQDENVKFFDELQEKIIFTIRDYFTQMEGRGVDHVVSALSNILGQQIALWMLSFEEQYELNQIEELRDKMFKEVTKSAYAMIRESIVKHYKKTN